MSLAERPEHIAIIMDGNGRWAHGRGHNRFFGHVRGAQVAQNIVEACAERDIKFLTLYAFSTENWHRPPAEINLLMKLLERQLKRKQAQLIKNNIRFRAIGNTERLPLTVRKILAETAEKTIENTGMTLCLALSYGGRGEILAACRKAINSALQNEIDPTTLDELKFEQFLETVGMPSPDLIIRTSGEQRLSNFLLWQAAYSELYFSERNWPDFTVADLEQALTVFSQRNRRFGKIQTNVADSQREIFHF